MTDRRTSLIFEVHICGKFFCPFYSRRLDLAVENGEPWERDGCTHRNNPDGISLEDLEGCKTLIVDSEDDSDMPGQAKKLYEALKCTKKYMLFRKEEGAEEHCQMGACFISTERIFNWLDKNL